MNNMVFDLKNGLYEEIKCFEPLKSFNANKMREIEENKIIVKGWNISNENSKLPLFFCDIIKQEVKMIKDTCIDFDVMSNKNIIIFNKNNIEIFDYKNFEIISKIKLPSDIDLMSACLYNDKTLLIGCKNEELIEFEMENNELFELDRHKLKCHLNHYVCDVIRLKNDLIVAIGDTEVYIFEPIK